jgi:hypothetical protein
MHWDVWRLALHINSSLVYPQCDLSSTELLERGHQWEQIAVTQSLQKAAADEKPPVPQDARGRCQYFHCHRYHKSEVGRILDDGPDMHCESCNML